MEIIDGCPVKKLATKETNDGCQLDELLRHPHPPEQGECLNTVRQDVLPPMLENVTTMIQDTPI